MTLSSAQRLIVFSFLFVVIVLVIGAFYYKNTFNSATSFQDSDTVTQEVTTQEMPQQEPVTLLLTPLSATEYRLSIEDLKQPVTAATIVLNSPEQVITSSDIDVASDLESLGWSTAINSSTDSESGQEFTFSMIRMTGTEATNRSSIVLGTITLSNEANLNNLILDTNQSKVVYAADQQSTINLVVETDSIDN